MQKPYLFALVAILVSSCVPTSKYQQLQQASRDYSDKVDAQAVQIDQLKGRIKELEADVASVAKSKSSLEQDTAMAGVRNRILSNQLSILENDLRTLAAKMGDSPEYRALLNHLMQMQDELADAEGRRITTERSLDQQKKRLQETSEALKASEQQLQENVRELDSKNQQLEAQETALAGARRSIEQQAARLRELEDALKSKDQAMADLKNSIANALADFRPDELSVDHRDGKVYVSLEEQLLFESGKYDVNDKGQQAIRKIAGVLGGVGEQLDIIVEGHTDDVPFHGQQIQDNWDLSAKRATSVLRLLLQDGSIKKQRIQAVGRADSAPIDNSGTAEARRKNRRTEIILAPRIDQIISIIK